jgi:hypothetical protein
MVMLISSLQPEHDDDEEERNFVRMAGVQRAVLLSG